MPDSSLKLVASQLPCLSATSINFFTLFCKAYLQTESIDHLSTSLRKGGVTDLEAFFPASRRDTASLSAYFKQAGLQGVIDFHLKQKSAHAKEDLLNRLKEYVADEADFDEVRLLGLA